VFETNRGYGAAIKEAWNQSDAGLFGFMDADGTCDPLFFRELCETLETANADVVVGCRLNRHSQMPLVRRLGNTVFALMLTPFSAARVRDAASGMRVVRRSALSRISPLPDGLEFSAAMSARAIMCREIEIVETDIPYKRRGGRSKLSVVKDGLRFAKVILQSVFAHTGLFNPNRGYSQRRKG